MTDTRELVKELEFEAKAAHHGDGLAALFWNAASTITALSERVSALEDERYRLAYAICGGEDAPGLLDGTSVEALVDIARKSAAMHMETIDRAMRAEHRIRALEEAIHDADQTLMLLGDTGWRKRHRAALTSGGRG